MIIDEITLYNFGLYHGRQSIELTPTSAKKPVILFGGLNGGGKTTFLDAIQLCLFGPHAKISNRGSTSYSEYLNRSINRGAEMPEASIEMKFRHTLEGKEDCYKLIRYWNRNGNGCKEKFDVWKNDVHDTVLAENWVTQVEDLIPPNIAHLFLFDGEKVERYASYENSAGLIGSAIQNLLGLDMVDQLEKDLIVYERRKRIEGKEDVDLDRIKVLEDQIKGTRKKLSELNQERASIQSHGIDRTKKSLQKTEEKYRKVGGDLFDNRIKLEEALNDASHVVSEGRQRLKEVSGGALPLLLVSDLLKTVKARDGLEESARIANEMEDVLHSRDKDMIEFVKSNSSDTEVLKKLRAYLNKDRKERIEAGKKPSYINFTHDSRSDLNSLVISDLKEVKKQAKKLLEEQRRSEVLAEKAALEYENIPSKDSLEELSALRDEQLQQLREYEAKHLMISSEIERLSTDLEKKEQTLTRLYEEDAKALSDHEDRQRVLVHAEKVKRTLNEFRKSVVERHLRRIEQLVLESYQQLLRKSSLITRLSIDSDTYAITLYGRDGDELTSDRLSAGERQLLAVAMLWGLGKASGRPLPTAIDTPLGRLDASHRIHMVERYLPFASHQVMLLSTDEEITGQYYERLKPWIGRSYHLDYDDNTGYTRIVSGYFDSVEAA